MITDANGYFEAIEQDIILEVGGDSLADDMRVIFMGSGGGANGAYEVIKHSLELLEGGTVKLKRTDWNAKIDSQTKPKELTR